MENQPKSTSRLVSFLWVLVAYVVGIYVFFQVVDYFFMQGTDSIWAVFWADVACTIVVFTFSYFFKNTSFYDPYWSVIPIVIVLLLAVRGFTEGMYDQTRNLAIVIFVGLWGLRLTWNWMRGWEGLHHIDWRYVMYEKSMGKWFWPFSFLGLQMFPTILVFLGLLPLFGAMTNAENDWNWLDIIATGLALVAILIEFLADNQLRKFRKTNTEKGKSLTTGLWKYSRHPNYFGEVSFWWAIFLFGLAANPSFWWTIIGAISMTVLFHFISIPMIEKRHLERKKDYKEVMEKVPRWIPWFPQK